MSASTKTVLIIGGGIAGITAISGFRKVDKSSKIVLVEPKDYMEIIWAAYRSPFEEWVAKGSLLALDGYCKKHNVQHLRQVVTKLTADQATLDNGETIAFDVCVVATGATSKWPGLGRGLPDGDGSTESRLKGMKKVGDELLKAKSVIIIGGGLIGTELAGDLASYAKKAGNKTMQVTLVHSGDHLCPEMVGNKASAAVKKQLEKGGVKVILNEKAIRSDDDDTKWALQKSGETIEAEKIVMTNGIFPINEFMKEGELEGSLTENGWIDTDDCFKVKGTDKILGFGDSCTTLPKSGSQLLANKAIIGNNMKAILDSSDKSSGGGSPALKEFKLASEVYLATTGRTSGVMYGGKNFWTTLMFPALKNKTMFFFRPKSELGF